MTEEKTLAFDGPKQPYHGYKMRAFYHGDSQNASVELVKDGSCVKRFSYPAYKIWNLAAHFEEIIDSEIAGDTGGYEAAGADMLGGYTMPQETEEPQ